jgi:SHS family sialic acid transporter-like MFS transporter
MSQPTALAADGSRGKWAALIAAFLGWMFDGFEIGLFPLVGSKALEELVAGEVASNSAAPTEWFGVIMSMFLVGAATGGVFFGWLGDRIGRVRAMSISILTYAVFTGLCGFAGEAWHIAALRFVASLGMGGEWALGVALVTELWPDRSRAWLAGAIGAAANVGFLLVALLSLVLVRFLAAAGDLLRGLGLPDGAVEKLLRGDGWRLLMIAGSLPALLVFFIRLFVPESRRWEEASAKGRASHWATRDLVGVLLGAMAAIGTVFLWSPLAHTALLPAAVAGAEHAATPAWFTAVRIGGTAAGFVVTLLGFLYPVMRYLHRAEAAGQTEPGRRGMYLRRMLLGACLAGVPLLGTWGSLQWAPKWATALSALDPEDARPKYAKEFTQLASASGAIVGTILAALAAGRFGRRVTYAVLCVASFVSLVYLYRGNDAFGPAMLASVFVAGGATAAFYGWFPLYFPEIFPTSIRATSQGFAYNFGRVLSAIGALQTAVLTAYFAQGLSAERKDVDGLASAGATLAATYLIGVVLIWFGPETRGKPLPD